MADSFFDGLTAEYFYDYYHMIRKTHGIVNLNEMPYYVNGYIQEYVFDKTSIDTLGGRKQEVPSFVDAMTPVPYVDEEGKLQNLLVGQTEITQGLYEYVMGENPSRFKGSGQLPVERVSWFDLLEFCNRLSKMQGFRPCYSNIDEDTESADWDRSANGYRLPTEWEWEYIAKANRDFEYSGGDNPDNVAWWLESSNERTHDVGGKKENSFGTYDQSGNVFERCWDLYWYDDTIRVLRGGSWRNGASGIRAARRNIVTPSYQSGNGGGRLARSPDPSEPLTK
jgi:formylglycine-generating enzyme required for sulfatase activity